MTDSCSLTDRSGYVNSSLAENLPSMDEYFSRKFKLSVVRGHENVNRLRKTVRTHQ